MDIENWIGTESDVQAMMERMQQAQQQAQQQIPGATQTPQPGNPSIQPENQQLPPEVIQALGGQQ
jgi:hypothetical protein